MALTVSLDKGATREQAGAASDPVVLADRTPLARGAVRDVWDHPGHPGQVLKTIRAYKREKYAARRGLRRMVDRLRLGPYGTFRIEYLCYLKTACTCADTGRDIPIAQIGGLVRTDHGLAQVCEKIADKAGALAPTLANMSGKLSDEQLGWLNMFVTDLYELNVNVPDLTTKNVVLDLARRRFVLIDGYGDKTLMPLRAWIRALNRRQLDARFAQMKVTDIVWDMHKRQFSRPAARG